MSKSIIIGLLLCSLAIAQMPTHGPYIGAGSTGGGVSVPSGTSGGVPCYTATTTIASSAALTAGAVVLGGGAGVCPSVLANSSSPGASQLWLHQTNAAASATQAALLIGPTGMSGWNASGTYLAISAQTGFGGRLADFRVNNSSMFYVDSSGAVFANNSFQIPSGNFVGGIGGVQWINNAATTVGNNSTGASAIVRVYGSGGVGSGNGLFLRNSSGGTPTDQLAILGDRKTIRLGQTADTSSHTNLDTVSVLVSNREATVGVTGTAIEAGPGQGTNDLFRVHANRTTNPLDGTKLISVNSAGRLIAGGTAPTITSGFGTTPSIAGRDQAGRVTIGTGGTASTGVVTFGGGAWTTAPACTANTEGEIKATRVDATTTTMTITVATAWTAGVTVSWVCVGY